MSATTTPPPNTPSPAGTTPAKASTTTDAVIHEVFPLGNQWPTLDPFLFVAHHRDAYPAGTGAMGPDAPLDGREIGADFADIDGWNMYHGSAVPGFPQHPHRGFETITYVRHGLIDHADSLGAAARFGHGDMQWVTAGNGIVHSEMFPLLNRDEANPLELFQIWLNLPAADKGAAPAFTMYWSDVLPIIEHTDANGAGTSVRVIVGALGEHAPPAPPPDSWAARNSDVAIWHVCLDGNAIWQLPAAEEGDTQRVVYAFEGDHVSIDHERLDAGNGARVDATRQLTLVGGPGGAELLVMQGRPIAEPVARYGPFVMNTRAEIAQAFDDYRATGFGGWPWTVDDPVHGTDPKRFARRPDGRTDGPPVEL